MRAKAFIDGLVAEAIATGKSGHEVLLVSHGSFLRVLLRDVFGFLTAGDISNSSITTVDVTLPDGPPKSVQLKAKAAFTVIKMNDCGHLADVMVVKSAAKPAAKPAPAVAHARRAPAAAAEDDDDDDDDDDEAPPPRADTRAAPAPAAKAAPPRARVGGGATVFEGEPPLLRLVIVRHGETTANEMGIIAGQSLSEEYKLTALGNRQAAAAGESLAERQWWKVVSSDLFRTRETTAHLIAENPDSPSPEWNKLIREFYCGLREGENIKCDEKRMIQLYSQKGGKFPPPKSETKSDVAIRAKKFTEQLVADACATGRTGHEVLVVSHGGFIRVLLRDVFGFLTIGEVSNTSISTVDITLPDGFPKKNMKPRVAYKIVKMNDCDHLGGRDGDLMSANKN